MNQYLQLILESKTQNLSNSKAAISLYDALNKEGLSVIGEIKKASPSKGLIKEDFEPTTLGKIYDSCVDAISVLTEEDYFLGHMNHLKSVNQVTNLPILCKDFIIDEKQVFEAKGAGASGILLIVAILSDAQLKQLHTLAEHLSLDVIVEVHSSTELERALKINPKIIGINNRDLRTFQVDIHTTLRLRQMIPDEILVVCESGLKDPEVMKALSDVAIDGVLIGEAFMRSHDINGLVKKMKEAYTYEPN